MDDSMLTLQKKICLIGDFSVGKTSLIKQYVFSQFDEKYLTTIGVHITKKEVSLDDATINLIIWDIAGKNGIQDITSTYLQGASGAILVGDISRKETIESLTEHHKNFREINNEKPIVLAINKIDLLDEIDPEINPGSANEIGFKDGTQLFKTSAKTAANVELLFKSLAQSMYENHKE